MIVSVPVSASDCRFGEGGVEIARVFIHSLHV